MPPSPPNEAPLKQSELTPSCASPRPVQKFASLCKECVPNDTKNYDFLGSV